MSASREPETAHRFRVEVSFGAPGTPDEVRVRGTLDTELFAGATFDFAELGREDRAWLGRTLRRALDEALGGPLPEGSVVIAGAWLDATLRAGERHKVLRATTLDEADSAEVWRALALVFEHVQGILRIDGGAGPGKPRPRGELPG